MISAAIHFEDVSNTSSVTDSLSPTVWVSSLSKSSPTTSGISTNEFSRENTYTTPTSAIQNSTTGEIQSSSHTTSVDVNTSISKTTTIMTSSTNDYFHDEEMTTTSRHGTKDGKMERIHVTSVDASFYGNKLILTFTFLWSQLANGFDVVVVVRQWLSGLL